MNHNSLCRGPKWPISNSDIEHWKFEYISKAENDADQYYIELITRYFNHTRRHNEGIPDVYY